MTTKNKPFRTILDEPKVTITPSGEKEEEIWAMKLDDKGNQVFYCEGKTNIYEKIQAHKDGVLLENLLKMCYDTNDMSILNVREAEYMDISEMPNNIYEAHRKIKEMENYFSTLPVEIRAKFDHNFDKFVAEAGTEEWIQKMKNEVEIELEEEKTKKEEKEVE